MIAEAPTAARGALDAMSVVLAALPIVWLALTLFTMSMCGSLAAVQWPRPDDDRSGDTRVALCILLGISPIIGLWWPATLPFLIIYTRAKRGE